jgi:hypothetical protein
MTGNLKKWVAWQRRLYHYGRLSAERIKLLEAIPGWQWRERIRRGTAITFYLREAEKICKLYDGMLPLNTQLVNIAGTTGMAYCIERNPKAFAHLKRVDIRQLETKRRLRNALSAYKDRDGIVHTSDLYDEEYGGKIKGFFRALRYHPDWFTDFKIVRAKNNKEHSLAVAQQLARQHKNVLPSMYWLNRHGYRNLVQQIYKYPRLFSGIKQEVSHIKHSPKDYYIPLAAKLARENGGVLQGSKWLQLHGYGGLDQVMRKLPRLFRHIEQQNGRTLYKENRLRKTVSVAEKLARKYGKLPNTGWLTRHGFEFVYRTRSRNPDFFSHIPQDRPGSCTGHKISKATKRRMSIAARLRFRNKA